MIYPLTISKEKFDRNEVISDKNIALQQKISLESLGAINKIIFVVSTGTFVLTVSFIGYLDTIVLYPKILVGSWICLILSIVGNAIVFYASSKASTRIVHMINAERAVGYSSGWDQSGDNGDKELIKFNKVGKYTSMIVISFLLIGIALTILFTSINLITRNELRKAESLDKKVREQVEMELNRAMIEHLKQP